MKRAKNLPGPRRLIYVAVDVRLKDGGRLCGAPVCAPTTTRVEAHRRRRLIRSTYPSAYLVLHRAVNREPLEPMEPMLIDPAAVLPDDALKERLS
jgi:hypothetical protein